MTWLSWASLEYIENILKSLTVQLVYIAHYCRLEVALWLYFGTVIQGDIQVLWHYWLGGRKGIRPVKNWVVGCWHGYLERGADLLMAQLMSLPLTVCCFSKIQIGFTFLVPAHLGSPGQRAVITGLCVCVIQGDPKTRPLNLTKRLIQPVVQLYNFMLLCFCHICNWHQSAGTPA